MRAIIHVEMYGGPVDGQLRAVPAPDDQLPVGSEIYVEEIEALDHSVHEPEDTVFHPKIIRHKYRITSKSYRGHWLAEYQP